MASHIVIVNDIEEIFNRWVLEVSKISGVAESVPIEDGKIMVRWNKTYSGEEADDTTECPFFCYKEGLFECLKTEKWARIKWFYYCDNDRGNTIRLYDEEHYQFENNSDHYLQHRGKFGELVGQRPDRVLIRGENLGKENQDLKLAIQRQFSSSGGRWPANSAPTDIRGRRPTCKTMRLCEQFFEKRLAYFQHANRNNVPGNSLSVKCCKGLCTAHAVPVLDDEATPLQRSAYEREMMALEKYDPNWLLCTKGGIIG
jgi:hypothetical protein